MPELVVNTTDRDAKPEERRRSFHARVNEARRISWKKMNPFREARNDIRKQIVTHLYGDLYVKGGNPPKMKEVIINKLRQMAQIYFRLLASSNPRFMVTVKYDELAPQAWSLKTEINNVVNHEIELLEELNTAIMEALYGIGIVNCELGESDQGMEADGALFDVGQPFVKAITLNNFVMDMIADSRKGIDWCGHRYWRTKAELLRKYPEREDHIIGGDANGVETKPTERLTGTSSREESRIYEYVMLWKMYFPKERVVRIYLDGKDEPLEEYFWEGPERGPYEFLSFFDVPDETMPSPPMYALVEMHEFINELQRKLGRRANNAKSVLAWEGQAEEDVKRIRATDDQGDVRVQHLDKMQVVKFDDVDGQQWNVEIMLDRMFDTQAGNLQSLGGLGPQSETLGQDEMLSAASGAQVDNMRRAVVRFTRHIGYRLLFYIFHHPFKDYQHPFPIPGGGTVMQSWTAAQRLENDFIEYNFDLDPYSMKDETPASKLQALLTVWERFVLPSMPIAMQAGWAPNFEQTARNVAEWTNMPFESIFVAMDPAMKARQAWEGPQGQGGGMPQTTTRRYERVSRPGTTPGGDMQNLMMANMGAKPQHAGAAGLATLK